MAFRVGRNLSLSLGGVIRDILLISLLLETIG
jgi:hypothetical protein